MILAEMNVKDLASQNYFTLENIDLSLNELLVDDLARGFQGYNKVIAAILMQVFGLPIWRTFVVNNLDVKTEKALRNFYDKNKFFFIRTDTCNGRLVNPSDRSCPADEVIETLRGFLNVRDRYALVLAIPNTTNQEFKNKANCRTGIIENKLIQEWVGPGFSEYHLGRDKFPHKSKLHACLEVRGNEFTTIYKVDRKTFSKDISQLFLSYGLEQLRVKESLSDRKIYKRLTGEEIQKEEPNMEELEQGFEAWLKTESSNRGISSQVLIKEIAQQGKAFLKNLGEEESALLAYLDTGAVDWFPVKGEIQKVKEIHERFSAVCEKIGMNSQNRILTFSLSPGVTEEDIVCWDVFNLLDDIK